MSLDIYENRLASRCFTIIERSRHLWEVASNWQELEEVFLFESWPEPPETIGPEELETLEMESLVYPSLYHWSATKYPKDMLNSARALFKQANKMAVKANRGVGSPRLTQNLLMSGLWDLKEIAPGIADSKIYAILAIIMAHTTLFGLLFLEWHESDPDMIELAGVADSLLSYAIENQYTELTRHKSISRESRKLKQAIVKQAIKNIFERFPNQRKTLGFVWTKFDIVNTNISFHGYKVATGKDPKTKKDIVLIFRPDRKRPMKYSKISLQPFIDELK